MFLYIIIITIAQLLLSNIFFEVTNIFLKCQINVLVYGIKNIFQMFDSRLVQPSEKEELEFYNIYINFIIHIDDQTLHFNIFFYQDIGYFLYITLYFLRGIIIFFKRVKFIIVNMLCAILLLTVYICHVIIVRIKTRIDINYNYILEPFGRLIPVIAFLFIIILSIFYGYLYISRIFLEFNMKYCDEDFLQIVTLLYGKLFPGKYNLFIHPLKYLVGVFSLAFLMPVINIALLFNMN